MEDKHHENNTDFDFVPADRMHLMFHSNLECRRAKGQVAVNPVLAIGGGFVWCCRSNLGFFQNCNVYSRLHS